MAGAAELIGMAKSGVLTLLQQLGGLFLGPTATYSLFSLASAFFLLAAVIVIRRLQRTKQTSLRLLLGAIFPRRILRHASLATDVKWVLFNSFLFTAMFGIFVLSDRTVSALTRSGLEMALGPQGPTVLPGWLAVAIATLLAFLALEIGYYVDHWTSHNIPVLWEFHKVHHSAEVLTPFTNSRVHPVESVIFSNILAVSTGLTGGALAYAFGDASTDFRIFNSNAIVFLCHYSLLHLLHTEAWISFTGWLGCIVTSPAHHQIHHSTDPRHFNRNIGGSLMIFDWLFGTLMVPPREKEALTFGVVGEPSRFLGFAGGFCMPFLSAGRMLAHGVSRMVGRLGPGADTRGAPAPVKAD